MLETGKQKNIIRIILWCIVATLCTAATVTLFLFVSLRSDMKMQKELAEFFGESGVAGSQEQIALLEAEIAQKMWIAQMVLMVSAILILFAVATAIVVNLVSKSQFKSKAYQYAYVDEVTG